MNWKKQISPTICVDVDITLNQWMIGFNVLDDRPPENIFGFTMLNIFIGPVRFCLMREPLRPKQLEWQKQMDRKEAEFELELEKLRNRHQS